MLQLIEWTRFIIVIFIQLPISAIFIYITCKVLKRRRDRVSYSFCAFFILISLTFISNAISFICRVNSLICILQVTILFLTLLSLIFLVVFNLNILRSESDFHLKTQILIILFYLIGILFILLIPGGITINEQTNWKLKCSWFFTIIVVLYIICFILIPTTILSLRIYHQFKIEKLKKRWKLSCIGLSGFIFVIIGRLFYNTWNTSIYKYIWLFLSLLILPSVILIYLGIGKSLRIQQ